MIRIKTSRRTKIIFMVIDVMGIIGIIVLFLLRPFGPLKTESWLILGICGVAFAKSFLTLRKQLVAQKKGKIERSIELITIKTSRRTKITFMVIDAMGIIAIIVLFLTRPLSSWKMDSLIILGICIIVFAQAFLTLRKQLLAQKKGKIDRIRGK